MSPRRSRTNKKKAKPLTAVSKNTVEDEDGDEDEDSAQSSSDDHTIDEGEDQDHDEEDEEEDTRTVTVQLGNTILLESSYDIVTTGDSCWSSSAVRPASDIIPSVESAPPAQSSVTPLPSSVPPVSAFSGRLLAHAISADRHKEADRSALPLFHVT